MWYTWQKIKNQNAKAKCDVAKKSVSGVECCRQAARNPGKRASIILAGGLRYCCRSSCCCFNSRWQLPATSKESGNCARWGMQADRGSQAAFASRQSGDSAQQTAAQAQLHATSLTKRQFKRLRQQAKKKKWKEKQRKHKPRTSERNFRLRHSKIRQRLVAGNVAPIILTNNSYPCSNFCPSSCW